jgi:hypothetical protein
MNRISSDFGSAGDGARNFGFIDEKTKISTKENLHA